ncbi:MAG: polyprenyl synthetase family protein [Candidatus Riflebacteria bacterium]|jgi:geranylgeranyl diphosphate synthase type II|nr:polyprenyl synthetase family protein [Candidatus Riflebacteria bacterium]
MTTRVALQKSSFSQYLENSAVAIEAALKSWLPADQPEVSANLHEAMRYSALAGGKRIRPALCLIAGERHPELKDALLRAGCAFELIHTYSLIHDDLPAMDNDDLRRGKPTNHKKFGEATAILAGDALLTLAFEWFASLVEFGVLPVKVVEILGIAAVAAGHRGMVGGQMLDIAFEKKKVDLKTLESIHRQKTGALIIAPLKVGAVIAGYSTAELEAIELYAARIGLLFQVIDDILDIEGDTHNLGKNTGRDQVLEKSTYPSLLGLDGAKNYALTLHHEARELLHSLPGEQAILAAMADFILNRNK